MSPQSILTRPVGVEGSTSIGKEKSRTDPVGAGGSRGTRVLRGLCTTCQHAQICMYLSKQEQPIFHCEEFDIAPGSERQFREAAPKSAASERPTHYRGLCLNCENNERCIYSGTEGGVWHCEMYI